MYFASPSRILCALGPGSLVLILGPAVEVMVCVAIVILVSKFRRAEAPHRTQPAISRPGLEDEERISRLQRGWRAHVTAAPPENGAGRPESPPSKPGTAPAIAWRTRMCCACS